jgi:hypothetical protein
MYINIFFVLYIYIYIKYYFVQTLTIFLMNYDNLIKDYSVEKFYYRRNKIDKMNYLRI